MFDLDLASPARDATSKPESKLSPARALLTPVWIASLVILVANDHFLKGSGLLPAELTGKLSDFAGMIVAPVLLAALLRVRSHRALLACHVAVGAVFAGIQLSPGLAASWAALMGGLGFPSVITSDPTDLLALPFLALAWKLLVPEMDARLPSFAPLQRTAVAALSLFGLWSTVATSQVEEGGIDGDDTWYEDVFGNLTINNANDLDIALFIRPLRSDVEIDCLRVAADPGRMLRPEAFGEAEHWLLPARTNVAVSFPNLQGCSAVWVGGEGIEPTILFVDELAVVPARWWSGQTFSTENLGLSGMAIEFDDTGSEWIGGETLRFVPRTEAPAQPEGCEVPEADSRLDWSPLGHNLNEVLSIESGVDGCFEVQLQPMVQGGSFDEPYTWYLCAPESAVPLTEGELLDIRDSNSGSGRDVLEVITVDPDTFEDARDEQGRLLRRIRYMRGASDPSDISPALGRELVAVPGVSCPWQVEAGCATVERFTDLAVAGGQSYFLPGQALSFADDTLVHTAVMTHARERAVVDLACTNGAFELSYDIDMVIIDEPLL